MSTSSKNVKFVVSSKTRSSSSCLISSSTYSLFTSDSSILTTSLSSDVMQSSSSFTSSFSNCNFRHNLTSLLYAIKISVASSKVNPESGVQHAGDTGGNVYK